MENIYAQSKVCGFCPPLKVDVIHEGGLQRAKTESVCTWATDYYFETQLKNGDNIV